MIAPNMATMLAFFTTDAAVTAAPAAAPPCARRWATACNRITVDGDTSTNDMAVVLASGACRPAIDRGGPRLRRLPARAHARPRATLAEMIVRDGEGATRIAGGAGRGRVARGDADRIARAIAESPLVEDRAARRRSQLGTHPRRGRPLRRRPSTSARVDIFLGDVWVAEGGARARLRRGAAPTRRCRGPGPHPRAPARGHAPPAGCGPATSRAATSTSTRTTGADERGEALGRQLQRGPDRGVLGVQPVVPLRPPAR